MSNFESKCMYCGSTSYGSGCIFSSLRIHVHTDDPTRCIYCGQMAYGSGCIFNPFTKMHIHGVDVGQTIRETVRKTVELSYITDRLLEDIKNTEAYKVGLINEKGNLIRAPKDIHEQRLVSPLSNFLFKLKKYIQIEPTIVIESLKMLSQNSSYEESVEEYERKLEAEQEFKHIIAQLQHAVTKNSQHLSLESLEQAVESALLSVIT